jgi:hypothetical protein
MGRQRGGGHREPMLHADAQRVLAEGDYPHMRQDKSRSREVRGGIRYQRNA